MFMVASFVIAASWCIMDSILQCNQFFVSRKKYAVNRFNKQWKMEVHVLHVYPFAILSRQHEQNRSLWFVMILIQCISLFPVLSFNYFPLISYSHNFSFETEICAAVAYYIVTAMSIYIPAHYLRSIEYWHILLRKKSLFRSLLFQF